MSMYEALHAIADPTRFEILRLVHVSDLPAGEIAKNFKDISRPAVSQHLKVLKDAGLVTEKKEGTRRLYRLSPEGFDELKLILEQFWNPQLIKLKESAERWRRYGD